MTTGLNVADYAILETASDSNGEFTLEKEELHEYANGLAREGYLTKKAKGNGETEYCLTAKGKQKLEEARRLRI